MATDFKTLDAQLPMRARIVRRFSLEENPCHGEHPFGATYHREVGEGLAVCDFHMTCWDIPECGDDPAPCNCADPTTHNGH